MAIDGMRRQFALVAVRIERLIKIHGSLDKAMFFVLNMCPSQAEVRFTCGSNLINMNIRVVLYCYPDVA